MSEDGPAETDGDRPPTPEPTTAPAEADTNDELARLRGEVQQLSVAVATLQDDDADDADDADPDEATSSDDADDAEDPIQRIDDLETRIEDYQRRAEREREALAAETLADFADRMLSVKDSLDNVLAMGDLDGDTERQIKLLGKQFEKSFTGGEVERIDTDCEFDASRHKMVERTVTDGYDDGEIVRELDAGYAIGDRVLRPARVVVAADTE